MQNNRFILGISQVEDNLNLEKSESIFFEKNKLGMDNIKAPPSYKSPCFKMEFSVPLGISPP